MVGVLVHQPLHRFAPGDDNAYENGGDDEEPGYPLAALRPQEGLSAGREADHAKGDEHCPEPRMRAFDAVVDESAGMSMVVVMPWSARALYAPVAVRAGMGMLVLDV
jgi:hypothetical protein